MKKNLYDDVKQRKPFVLIDIAVYAAIVLTVVGFFLAFIIFPKNENSDGFKVFVDEKEIFVFYYDTCDYETKEYGGKIEMQTVEDKKTYVVRIFPRGDQEFNLLYVNAEEKTVKITDANCSNRKDCVYTPEIKSGSGAIYCMPHKLKVLPIKSDYRPIRTGGL